MITVIKQHIGGRSRWQRGVSRMFCGLYEAEKATLIHQQED